MWNRRQYRRTLSIASSRGSNCSRGRVAVGVGSPAMCPAVSGSSSVRGGCSTRASHLSRLLTLTRPAADASQILHPPATYVASSGSAIVTPSGRGSTLTQVSVRLATQLRRWSYEITAIRRHSLSAVVATGDDQRRSSRIRPRVRRWSVIPCNDGPFGHIGPTSKSGAGSTYGGQAPWSSESSECRSSTAVGLRRRKRVRRTTESVRTHPRPDGRRGRRHDRPARERRHAKRSAWRRAPRAGGRARSPGRARRTFGFVSEPGRGPRPIPRRRRPPTWRIRSGPR
jgi:hypothetical protein